MFGVSLPTIQPIRHVARCRADVREEKGGNRKPSQGTIPAGVVAAILSTAVASNALFKLAFGDHARVLFSYATPD
jgi:hypothetical protein